jgi:formyltetrahydrofolate deformylase
MTRDYVVMVAGPHGTGLQGSVEAWLRGCGAVLGTNVRALSDRDKRTAYVRIEFSSGLGLDELQSDLADRKDRWSLEALQVQCLSRPKMLVLASLADHCVFELLSRHQADRLGADIVAVAANHQTLQGLVELYGVPFVHIPWPSDDDGAEVAHAELAELIKQTDADFVVMARFMRILPGDVCRATKVLNIHHDDSRRYRGANPYARVRRHGSRTIAATTHFATEVLDDGHIIAQESRHIDVLGPMPSTAELTDEGRQVEVAALMEGVRRYVRGEVFVLADRTMYFPA